MITPSTLMHYRAPQGRPRAIPPCDVGGGLKGEADPRPVRELGESPGRYGARVMLWLDRQDPARVAARRAKMVATQRKNLLRRKREQAASTVKETATARWFTYVELSAATGLSYWTVRDFAKDNGWPIKKLPTGGKRGSPKIAVFGDPSTMPSQTQPVTAKPVLILAPPVAEQMAPPPLSLWQRVKGWFV